MPYLVDELPPPPIIVTGTSVSPYVIIMITLVLFIIFWAWIIILIRSDITTGASTGTSDGVGNKLLLSCGPGECGTNMQTGEKRCPVLPTDIILIDPGAEVCNPKFRCTSPQTPYALLADGSTNAFGVCDPNTTCRCLNIQQCATQVTAIFATVNGSVFNQASDNRFTFSQVSLRDNTYFSNVGFTDTATNFCGVKAGSLNRISPGSCTFTDADFTNPVGMLKVATDCINTNPCVVGTLAFQTPDPVKTEANGIGTQDVLNIPVACVKGSPASDTIGTLYPDGKCPSGHVPFYDLRYGLVRCTPINYQTI